MAIRVWAGVACGAGKKAIGACPFDPLLCFPLPFIVAPLDAPLAEPSVPRAARRARIASGSGAPGRALRRAAAGVVGGDACGRVPFVARSGLMGGWAGTVHAP